MSHVLSLVLCWSSAVAAAPAPAAPEASTKPDVWQQAFDRPAVLARLDGPVICVLAIEHADVVRKRLEEQPIEQYGGRRVRARVEQITGMKCLLFHFTELEGNDLDRPQVKAILITGRSRGSGAAMDQKFYPLIRGTRIPMIGFCGGMQLISKAFGAKVTSMRKLRPDEKDPNPKYNPGLFKEWGFMAVKVAKRDPLFQGLPDEFTVREAHAFHVAAPPPGFELLASTEECKVQAIKHKDRVLYGTQFHPEAYDDKHPHGRAILENFFRQAGIKPKGPEKGPGSTAKAAKKR